MSPLLFALHLTAAAQSMGPWLDAALPAASSDSGEGLTVDCPENHLSGGVRLPPAPDLYRIIDADRTWGRPEMIELITRTAEEMAWLRPHAGPIIVGDISRRYGGLLDGHKSHRAGVDADLGLYWGNGRTQVGGFPNGKPDDLDVETTWLLIRSMLDTGLVERILLDQALIDRLKRYTILSGELSRDEAERIFPEPNQRHWTDIGIVHHVPNHREHIHVRVLCYAD